MKFIKALLEAALLFAVIDHGVLTQPLDDNDSFEPKVRDKRKLTYVPDTLLQAELNGKAASLPTLPELPTNVDDGKTKESETSKSLELDPMVAEGTDEESIRTKKHSCFSACNVGSVSRSADCACETIQTGGRVIVQALKPQAQPQLKMEVIQPQTRTISIKPNYQPTYQHSYQQSYQPIYAYQQPSYTQYQAYSPGFQHEIHQPQVVYYTQPSYSHINHGISYDAGQQCSYQCVPETRKIEEKTLLDVPHNQENETEASATLKVANELSAGINQLHAVTQRLADLQVQNARMHHDHMQMLAGVGAYPYLRSTPILPNINSFGTDGTDYSHMRMYGGIPRKNAEIPTVSTPGEPQKNAETPAQAPSPMPENYARFYPSYNGYYGIRSQSPYVGYTPYVYPVSPFMKSETGFNVPPLFRSHEDQIASPKEVQQFYATMYDMGKKMSVLPKEKENEQATKSEDAVSDLVMGGIEKAGPTKVEVTPEKRSPSRSTSTKKDKRDKRGLITKN